MNTSKLSVLAASLLALVTTASAADMSSVKIGGFVAASYQYATAGGGSADSVFSGATAAPSAGTTQAFGWGDAAKVAFSASEGPLSGTVSLFYYPNAATELGILDAYVTYDAGSGWTVKVGKYLSPLGYEAFNIPDMIAITYGPTIYAIAGYHTGVQVDYSDKEWGAGLGVVDSIGSVGGKFFAGDNSFKGNKGVEGYVTYKGLADTVIWAGFSHEGTGGPAANTESVTTYDIWATYQLTKEASIFAEWVQVSEATAGAGSTSGWEAGVIYAFDAKTSVTFRVGTTDKTGADETQYTVAPTYKVNDHFKVKAEISSFEPAAGSKVTFFGLQGVYTF